jgi:hypothetical protein
LAVDSVKIKYETRRVGDRRVTTAKNNAVTCPSCGSNCVELIPSVYVRSISYVPSGPTTPYMACNNCKKVSNLTPEVNLELAKYVLENDEDCFVAEETYQASVIIKESEK